MLIPAAVILGIAVVGERDYNGLAHLTLLPMEMIGLAWLAANFCLRRWVACLILAGALVDFPLGVMLQARVENLENSPGHTVFSGLSFVNGGFAPGVPGPESLSRDAWNNWIEKHQNAMFKQWQGELDRYRGEGPVFARKLADVRAGTRRGSPRRPETLARLVFPPRRLGDVMGGCLRRRLGPVRRCRRRCGWRCSG